MIVRRGMSAYPDQSYYDPSRPGWLPYFIDTPTESLAKYQAQSQVEAAGKIVGGWFGSAASGIVGGAGEGLLNSLFGPKNCDPADFWCNYGVFILLAGLGVGAYMALSTGSGRRYRR